MALLDVVELGLQLGDVAFAGGEVLLLALVGVPEFDEAFFLLVELLAVAAGAFSGLVAAALGLGDLLFEGLHHRGHFGDAVDGEHALDSGELLHSFGEGGLDRVYFSGCLL